MEGLFGPILVKQQQMKKKNNNNNLTIQNTSNYYKVFKWCLQYWDEYSVVTRLPFGALCNDQTDYDDQKDK
jgi:hypothetical protein